MRPLQLSFSGIRSYPGTVGPLDFTGKTLIAILGDTGSGKSTLLEAITLGLYGNCTWTDREHRVLMAEGASDMTVDFTFAHDGQRWRVRRVFHANTTPSTHLLQNLDTGEKTDNKRAVNARIQSLLQLPFDSFITAVLLPQGKFDRLLTAKDSDRTGLLKGIFGVRALETIRERAGGHRDQLTELIHQAELARRDLLNDPAATAAAAARDAEHAENLAGYLHQALGSLRSCRDQATAARDHHAKLVAAGASLDQHEKTDPTAELAHVTQTATELDTLDNQAGTEKQALQDLRDDADARLADAAKENLTAESLAAARAVLDGVPGRLEELASEQTRLTHESDDLADQERELEASAARLSDMHAQAAALGEAHTTAGTELEEYRLGCESLQDATSTALREAVNARKALGEDQHASQRMQELEKAAAPLRAAAEATAAEARSAGERLTEIRSREAAHTAGAGQSPGEPCLICQRALPSDYQPPSPADPDALRAAERAVTKAKKEEQNAATAHTTAQADAAGARRDSKKRHSDARQAQENLENACQEALQAVQELARRRWDDGTSSAGEQQFEAGLRSECARLSEPGQDNKPSAITASVRRALAPARALEKALTQAAEQAGTAARRSENDAKGAAEILTSQRKQHKKAQAKLIKDRERQARTQSNLAGDLMSLPAPVKELIPATAQQITASHIESAKRIVDARQRQLSDLRRARDNATGGLEKLATAQRQRDQRRTSEVTATLQGLGTYLQRWQDTIEQADTALAEDQRVNEPMPTRPTAITVDSISAYAAALDRAERGIRNSLAHAANAASENAAAKLLRLNTAAASLSTGQDDMPAITLPTGEQLLAPTALDPVVAAERSAHDDARRHRASQATAQGQIEPAASLDSAIRAGRARLTGVDAVRGLLADAKFLTDLTQRRTRALLGVASGMFGRLSGGEFGFAEDFQIISRRTGGARGPKTLSGGETFLASLALSLALVELHSRSGTQIDALFLDEGFGSLDVDALASSLAVLQAETGGDKLVAVISHLHAVAEAVEEVMWVERRPEGSSARWLTTQERDALVRQEVSGGLLDLI
jgi:DNA repair protein SbcC/Rad50